MHLVGVGGVGMSAYARAAAELGAQLSGSDASEGPYLQALAQEGLLEAHVGHRAENVPAGEDVELYYSTAIPADNPERREARRRGLHEGPRAELVGALSSLRRTIAVAGTHGKTTTAAMTVHVLRALGMDPGWLVGAPIGGGLENASWSGGEWLVVEADESDRSMLALHAEIALLTNVELDHPESFSSLGELRTAFAELLAGVRVAVIWDRPELLELRAGHGPLVAYDARELTLTSGGSRSRWRGREVVLGVPGAHNATDAAGALEAAWLAWSAVCARDEQRQAADGERGGVEGEQPPEGFAQPALAALAAFGGAGRRFQALGRTKGGAEVVEDYAHHPTEVAATLAGARTLAPRRLVAVFQPHMYSRTMLLARDFGAALAAADVIAVLDVYAARERAEDFPGVSGLRVAEAAADRAGGRMVLWLAGAQEAANVLGAMLREGDLCVVMGAGDVDALARELVRGAGDER
jgi:UDP-N-acetylmuramate--alanine ligase